MFLFDIVVLECLVFENQLAVSCEEPRDQISWFLYESGKARIEINSLAARNWTAARRVHARSLSSVTICHGSWSASRRGHRLAGGHGRGHATGERICEQPSLPTLEVSSMHQNPLGLDGSSKENGYARALARHKGRGIDLPDRRSSGLREQGTPMFSTRTTSSDLRSLSVASRNHR